MKKIDYVNVKHGTENSMRFSHGNALPLIAMPHGMATFSLQTDGNSNWFYDPRRNYYEGIRLTHQPSPWNGDYGHLLLVPQSGEELFKPNLFWSSMRRSDTVMKPHYLKVESLRYRCITELVPSLRGAFLKIKYQNAALAKRLTIIPFEFDSAFSVDVRKKRLTGYTKAFNHSSCENFTMFIAMRFNSEIDTEHTTRLFSEGKGEGISVAFLSDEVSIRFAISFISAEQAERNLETELAGESFESLYCKGEEKWEEILNRIKVDGGDESKKRIFYSRRRFTK